MCLSSFLSSLSLDCLVRREMAPKVKWTSKADNGRNFRGKPKDRERSDVTRQFKKPRQYGADKVLQTDAIDVEVGGESGRDHWYIESSSSALKPLETVCEAEQEVVEVQDSEDSEDDNIPVAQTILKDKGKVQAEDVVSSEEETQRPETEEFLCPKLGLLGIGTEVMRKFDAGLFSGTVQSYDRKTDLYKILYSDGDGEDMDYNEYVYAYQLAIANGGDANDLSSRDSAEEESAYQLPKEVTPDPHCHTTSTLLH